MRKKLYRREKFFRKKLSVKNFLLQLFKMPFERSNLITQLKHMREAKESFNRFELEIQASRQRASRFAVAIHASTAESAKQHRD